ncbi:hypothetical protein EMIHUDRAFT_235591 [Emiliania huxleyi CCMP1516]|uniref:Plastocyanin-like domain-containing protein n=2 Tax=Emiliania huxleyi TaxID=2903 RepID=A0A0D3JVQ2_EMIH1|nr:hypothetical protein EMIHUDRAFT_235591 [Emiliania huxleyi CCMP1516]EOD27587.1 hypothetical protein EMIHUDRAFT_235591 [Emiliania huxleyi CCMP1516]|eukprot:XP_005780016.1 hypothetical protein EMIHUDRAFT_235591 [Emiliania huxleyi CCMP1516]
MLACGISLTLTATGFGTHGGAAPAGVSPAMRNTAQSFCERTDRSTPPEVNCKLVFSEVTFSTANAEGPMTFKTRGYNADSPLGPTIRVKPGDLLKVELFNELTDMTIGSLSGGTIGIHNYQHDYLITNLHLHGLHISGEAKSDNIFVMVRSGRSFGYEYMIPPDHMGGTHWYHPHWHGATGIQSGGGAVGMLVVEDAPGTLPSFLENTAGSTDKELELFILGMDLDNVRSISDGYLNCCKGYHNASIPFVDLKAAGYCQAKFGGDQPHLNPEKRANDLSKMADKGSLANPIPNPIRNRLASVCG